MISVLVRQVGFVPLDAVSVQLGFESWVHPLPTGNPFDLYVKGVLYGETVDIIETGLWMAVPEGFRLEIYGAEIDPTSPFNDPQAFPVGYWIEKRGLMVAVVARVRDQKFQEMRVFAKARLAKVETDKVRFIEVTDEGKRMVRGEGMKVESRD